MDKNKFIEIVKPYTQTGEERISALFESLEYIRTSQIKGDFVECGIWKGGNVLGILEYLDFYKIYDVKVCLYDTFSGQTKPDIIDENIHGGNAIEMINSNVFDYNIISLNEVKEILSKTNFPIENIIYVVGDVEETLNNKENIPDKIALLRLDTDFYKSTKKELEILYPVLSNNGILIVDDYGYWKGSKLAVDEYFKSIKCEPEIYYLMENNTEPVPTFQGILIKKNNVMNTNLFSRALNYIGKNKRDIFVTQIGALDGIIADDSRFYLNKYNWKALLVEPIPEWFEKLKNNFKDRNYIFENSAITNYDGEVEMVTIPGNDIIKENLHPDYRGMSTVIPPKKDFEGMLTEKYSIKIKVPSLSLKSLFEKHSINKIDIFLCDAEGYDWEIFNQFDFTKFDPYFIRIEFFHLTDNEKYLLKEKLENNGYVVEIDQNIDAVKKSLLEEINSINKHDLYGYSRVYNIKSVIDYKITEHYRNLIAWLIALTNCQSYLELGIEYGLNIQEIKKLVKICVGVDIAKNINTDGFEFYQMTTNNFFEINDRMFDIIFIDANHNFEQVKIDFDNSLKVLNKYGIIILHDTDPIIKELLSPNHCHDSYKIIDYILSNDELNIITLPIQETGMTFVMRKNDRRVKEFKK